MSFSKALVLILSLVASSSALATPHLARNALHHRALAHRAPIPAPAPVDILVAPIRKRANGKRCKQRSTSVAASSSAVPTSSAVVISSAVINVAPDPTTVAVAAPTTTAKTTAAPVTTKAAPTTTTKAAATTTAPASSSGSEPSYMTGTQTGQGTYYATGLGACGITNSDTDYIAAVSHLLFDTFPGYNGVNPNSNPVCNRKVKATLGGKSVTVAITDRCTGCALTDLDFSPSAFNQLADFSIGRFSGMTWVWV